MSTKSYGVIGKDSSTDELPEKSAPPTDGVHHDTAFQLVKHSQNYIAENSLS